MVIDFDPIALSLTDSATGEALDGCGEQPMQCIDYSVGGELGGDPNTSLELFRVDESAWLP